MPQCVSLNLDPGLSVDKKRSLSHATLVRVLGCLGIPGRRMVTSVMEFPLFYDVIEVAIIRSNLPTDNLAAYKTLREFKR